MPLLKTKLYTIDDIYALPDGKRAELLDGRIYDMAPPSPLHQELVAVLTTSLQNYIAKLHCKKTWELQSLSSAICSVYQRG